MLESSGFPTTCLPLPSPIPPPVLGPFPDPIPDPSPIKIYVDAQNNFYLNSNPSSISIGSIEDEIKKEIGENKAIELLADKDAHRASAYEIIRIAKQNALKVVIKTKGSK